MEQNKYEILSQILEGNRKITNDEFLSLCVRKSRAGKSKKIQSRSLLSTLFFFIFSVESDTEEEEIFPIGHEYDLDRQFYIIHLDKPLKDETIYEISINFTSILNDDLSGFYRSSYIEDGKFEKHNNMIAL